MYVAKLPITGILSSSKFVHSQILSIHCSIYSEAYKINNTVLAGRLQLR